MPDQQVMFKVKCSEPSAAPAPLFSNYVGISRAATEVQFEFVALDLNQIASLLDENRGHAENVSIEIGGKTVAKIVVPLHVFLQLKPHLVGLFEQIESELNAVGEGEEENHEPTNSSFTDVPVQKGRQGIPSV